MRDRLYLYRSVCSYHIKGPVLCLLARQVARGRSIMNEPVAEELPTQYLHNAAVPQNLMYLLDSLNVDGVRDDPIAQEAAQRLANFGFASARVLGYTEAKDVKYICGQFRHLPAASPRCKPMLRLFFDHAHYVCSHAPQATFAPAPPLDVIAAYDHMDDDPNPLRMRNADPGKGTVFDITHALEKHGLLDHDRPERVGPRIFQAAQREADESFALGRPGWRTSPTSFPARLAAAMRPTRRGPFSDSSGPSGTKRPSSSSDTCKPGPASRWRRGRCRFQTYIGGWHT